MANIQFNSVPQFLKLIWLVDCLYYYYFHFKKDRNKNSCKLIVKNAQDCLQWCCCFHFKKIRKYFFL